MNCPALDFKRKKIREKREKLREKKKKKEI